MTTTAWPTTATTELLGTRNPIVLGAFGGVSSVDLTAAVSNAGGLGSYGLYGYDADRIRDTVARLNAATSAPYALNLWLPHDGDQQVEPTPADFDAWVEALTPFFDELGLPTPSTPQRYLPTFDEQFDAVMDAAPAVLSVVFGVPSPAIVDRAHTAGCLVLGTATTVDEAVALEAGGVDAIIASGMEAAGHRVSFLLPAERSLIGTFALVPQVADAVRVPVIAAGGIADGRGVAAAITLGASGVQIGSAFLATRQSEASDEYRAALAGARETVLTRGPSGRLARGIPNRLTATIPAAPFPVQNWLTGQFRRVAGERGVTDLMSLWAGQASPLIREMDAATLVARLVQDAAALLPR